MKTKIVFVYLLSLVIFMLCACSEVANTCAKELRAGYWIEENSGDNNIDDDITLSLYFKGDDGVINIKDNKKNKSWSITGSTLVTENQIVIKDTSTLTDYSFDYDIKGDSVNIVYNNKTLTLIKK